MQKYGERANLAVKEKFVCIICCESKGFNWSDKHGEGMCNICGTPYQLLQYDKEDKKIEAPPKINIKEEFIPILKRYWNETHQYTGLGRIIIYRDYPECERGQKLFYEWLDKHPEYDYLKKKE